MHKCGSTPPAGCSQSGSAAAPKADPLGIAGCGWSLRRPEKTFQPPAPVGRAGRFSSAEDAVILQLEYRIGMNWDAVMEADHSDGQVLANRTSVSASVGVGSTYNAL